MLDLILAIGHHLLIFGIFGVLFAEFWALQPGMTHASSVRLASIDGWYGAFAGAIMHTVRLGSGRGLGYR